MIIIGERVNATRKDIWEAIRTQNYDHIKKEIINQDKAGADYIDLNAGTGSGDVAQEINNLRWLIDIALECTEKKIALDSADPKVLSAGARHIAGRRQWLVNSVKGDKFILDSILPLAIQYKIPVIALAMDDNGIPDTASARIKVCETIFYAAAEAGMKSEHILFDPLVFPLSTDSIQAKVTIDTLKKIKELFPDVLTTIGVSNVSHGLPRRTVINQAFLIAALSQGLDAAICDPTNPDIIKAMILGEMIAGKDNYCRCFTRSVRGGRFD